jgi:hypothetical protein
MELRLILLFKLCEVFMKFLTIVTALQEQAGLHFPASIVDRLQFLYHMQGFPQKVGNFIRLADCICQFLYPDKWEVEVKSEVCGVEWRWYGGRQFSDCCSVLWSCVE